MKKSVLWLLVVNLILGIGFTNYYSFQKYNIAKFNWTGTTYLAKDEWGNVIADNNIFDVDLTVTNTEGNPGPVAIQIVDSAGALLGEEKTITPGETVIFKEIPWDSGTVLIQAKATIDGVYEFKVINEKVVD